jgi:sugar lactone lactonase YvrE
MRSSFLVSTLLLGCLFPSELGAQVAKPVPVYRWTTLAGRASIGHEDGPVTEARFNQPCGLAIDLDGNLFVADGGNHTIRKITPGGVVSTFAGKPGEPGSADGPGSAARFKNPQGVAVDRNGNVFVADTGNHTIRLITPAGAVTTLAGQPGQPGKTDGAAHLALFNTPSTLTVDGNGSVYLLNGGVRKISGGLVQTIPLPAATNRFGQPFVVDPVAGPAVDSTGRLYLYDKNKSVLRLDPTGQLVVLFDSSSFWGSPGTLFNNVTGNVYWVRDMDATRDANRHEGNGIRPDGSFESLRVTFDDEYGYGAKPLGVAVDRNGIWYNTRATDHAIMRGTDVYAGTPRSGVLVDGAGGAARFESIYDLAVDFAGNVWVQEANFKLYSAAPSQGFSFAHSLRKISATDRNLSTLLAPQFAYASFQNPRGLGTDATGQPYVARFGSMRPQDLVFAALTGEAVGPDFTVEDFAMDASGNMWAASYNSLSRRPAGGAWAAVAGGGSYLDEPRDGQGTEARLGRLSELAFDAEGNCYALARYQEWANPNNTVHTCFIRKITPAGTVTTVGKDLVRKSGPANAVVAEYPSGFAVLNADTFLVSYRHEIVQLDAQGNAVILAGKTGERGTADGLADQVRFDHPASITVDGHGNLFLADGDGATVRKGQYLGYVPSITTQPQNLTVAAGANVQFSVAATSTPPPTYQWYFNGNPLQGATGSTLSFPNARASDAGDYTVVVTNSAGSITSGKAVLTVNGAPVVTPPAPAPSGGGGGAPSAWFMIALLVLGAARTRGPFRTS